MKTFNDLYKMLMESLIVELNSEESKTAKKEAKKREHNDFGKFFQHERTIVIDNIDVDTSIFLNMYAFYSKDGNKHNFHKIENIIKMLGEDVLKSDDVELDLDSDMIKYKVRTNNSFKFREVSIGKFLSKLKLKCFIVISHNCYDIAGVSTDKNWTSCNNLRNGVHSDKPYKEIKNGGMVAYLIIGDSKNVDTIMDDHKEGGKFESSAIARIAIRRFWGKKLDYEFVCDKIYNVVGADSFIEKIGFKKLVDDIISENNLHTNKESTIEFDRKNEYIDGLNSKYNSNVLTEKINNVEYVKNNVEKFEKLISNKLSVIKNITKENTLTIFKILKNIMSKIFELQSGIIAYVNDEVVVDVVKMFQKEIIVDVKNGRDFLSHINKEIVDEIINDEELLNFFQKYFSINSAAIKYFDNKFDIVLKFIKEMFATGQLQYLLYLNEDEQFKLCKIYSNQFSEMFDENVNCISYFKQSVKHKIYKMFKNVFDDGLKKFPIILSGFDDKDFYEIISDDNTKQNFRIGISSFPRSITNFNDYKQKIIKQLFPDIDWNK